MPQVAWEDIAGSGDDGLVATSTDGRTPFVADEYGNPMAFGSTDNAIVTFPIDERIVEFQHFGVLNGSFARGPASPDDLIEDINALPDWTGPVSVSGGAITAQWVADSSSPSGYNLRFNVNPGAASDEAYFEQIIPVGGTRTRVLGHYVRLGILTVASTATFTAYWLAQYLDASLATVGSSVSPSTNTPGAGSTTLLGGFAATSAAPVATARYLRLRIGIQRGAAGDTDTGTFDITDVRIDAGRGRVVLPDTADAAKGAAYLEQANQAVTISTGTGALSHRSIAIIDGANQVLSLDTRLGGIQFPATQIAIADANTLDDYEEGTFVPALAYATVGTSSWAVTTAAGFYTKIGERVFIHGMYQGVPTNGTGAGNLQMTGLPFASQNTANSGASMSCQMQGYTKAGFTWVCPNIAAGVSLCTFQASGSGNNITALAVGDIPSGGTVIVRFSGHYFV